jgi:hypothetical protein
MSPTSPRSASRMGSRRAALLTLIGYRRAVLVVAFVA